MQGWCDSELTQKGKQQAQQAGNMLSSVNFDTVVTSDLCRAKQTRDIILQQLAHQPKYSFESKYFREVLFGFFEGLDSDETWLKVGSPYGYNTQSEIIEAKGLPEARRLMRLQDPTHLAETSEQVLRRWRSGIQLLRKKCQNASNVLLVTHGTFIRSLAEADHIPTLNDYPKNGAVSILQIESNSSKLISYNKSCLDN
jgi:probable phosphoglycerate mutase